MLLRNGADPDDGDVEGRKPKDVAESDAVKEHLATYHALWVADNAPKPCKGECGAGPGWGGEPPPSGADGAQRARSF